MSEEYSLVDDKPFRCLSDGTMVELHPSIQTKALAKASLKAKADAAQAAKDAIPDFDKMKVFELEAHASKEGIDLSGATLKTEMVAAIKAHHGLT